MITLRPSQERGFTEFEWLKSWHTFSFNQYYDPKNTHFQHLRVMNDDIIAPGGGFGMHPHKDMEIITYVVSGALIHKDSLGNGSIVKRGEIQRMSAGSGILHSEHNASETEPLHLYQIWIYPEKQNLAPGYEQKEIDFSDAKGKFKLIASKNADMQAVRIHQDAFIYLTLIDNGSSIDYPINKNRHVWLQVIKGEISINDNSLQAGSGAAFIDENKIRIVASLDSELLLFNLK